MSLEAEMDPVHAPGTRVAQRPHRPQVDQIAAVVVGDSSQVHVVSGDAAAQQPDHGENAHVEAGEDEDPAARRLQVGHRLLEAGSEHIPIRPAQNVVAASRQAYQVRRYLDRTWHLLSDDLAEYLSPDGQVRVAESGSLRGHGFGDAVGPAPEPAARVRVVQSFSETVAQGDE